MKMDGRDGVGSRMAELIMANRIGDAERKNTGELMVIYLRLEKLRRWVRTLPVQEDYRSRLLESIERYADQILARPNPPPADQWDDAEALQQVTLGDWNEEFLASMFQDDERD